MKFPKWFQRSPQSQHTPVRPALQRVVEHAHSQYFVPRILRALPRNLEWGDDVVINRHFKLELNTITDPERIVVSLTFVDGEVTHYFTYDANTGDFAPCGSNF